MGRNVGPTPRPLGDLSWMDDAACREADPRIFYPVAFDGVLPEAKALCDVCPVKNECLEGAIARFEKHGTWGGVSADELRRIRQRRARARQRYVA